MDGLDDLHYGGMCLLTRRLCLHSFIKQVDTSRLEKPDRAEQDQIQSGYKTLNVELGLTRKPMTPTEFVPRLASELDAPDQLRQRALSLAREAEQAGVTNGLQRSGFAEACLYVAGLRSKWLTQREVAEAANTSTATSRTHCERLDTLAE